MSTPVQIAGIGLAVPEVSYSQADILGMLGLLNSPSARFFEHPHVERRHLAVPPMASENGHSLLPTGKLLEIFREQSMLLGRKALGAALAEAGLQFSDIDHVCCVTSTGFIVPPLSAHFVKELPLRADCQRIDLVGMGCNAGVNAITAVRGWCLANPGKTAALICSEICSAIYDIDQTAETALANSLFGDGVAAVLFRSEPAETGRHARVLGTASLTVPAHIDALRFQWQGERSRFGFYIDRKTPVALGANVLEPIERLLTGLKLQRGDIQHWVFHSGGAAILDLVEQRLELPPEALRVTRSTLRRLGNVSSASVFFTYEELLRSGQVKAGDRGVMVAMGPGLAIETAALVW